MLRIIQLANAASAKAYYSVSDYMLDGQELPGVWGGKGARMLGLEGQVSDEFAFDRLCDNRHPQTGKQLTANDRGGRRVGWDFNWHAPKSVTLAYELLKDDRVLGAFRDAVDYAMGQIEADMQTRVRKGGAFENREVGNLVAATFVHRTARPVNGTPDPHLHAHTVVFNAVHDPAEGKWKAAEIADLKKYAPYYEALFHARLAENVAGLGLGVERKGKGWEVAGIDRATLEKFSRRTQLIERVAAQAGITKPESKDGLGAKTRERKADHLTPTQLRAAWVGRLTAEEKHALTHLPSQTTPLPSPAKSAAYALSHAFERESVVATRKVLEHGLRHGVGRVTLPELKTELDRAGMLTKGDRSTTKEMLALEARVIQFARDGRGTRRPARAAGINGGKAHHATLNAGQSSAAIHGAGRQDATDQAVADLLAGKTVRFYRGEGVGGAMGESVSGGSWYTPDLAKASKYGSVVKYVDLSLADLQKYGYAYGEGKADEFVFDSPELLAKAQILCREPDRPSLNAGQRAAVNHVLTSRDRVTLIRGAAGTGKTFALKVAADGIREAGLAVQAIAISSGAAQELEQVDAGAATVARFLADTRMQDRVAGGVVILDEASLLGTRQAAELVGVLERIDARLAMVGDVKQHNAVAAGSPFRAVQEYASLPVAEMTDVLRQRGKYKAVAEELSEHKVGAALDRLDAMGWVKQLGEQERLDAIAADYLDALHRRQSVLIVAPTRNEADAVTARVREALKQDGRIQDGEREFLRLVPLHLTEAQSGDALPDGAVVQFHRAAGRHKPNDRLGGPALRDVHRDLPASAYAAYQPGSLRLAAGDVVRITANGKDKSGKHKLLNGAAYAVTGFDRHGDIKLSNGWTVAADFGHLAHGYVTTSHASQGKTVDTVLVAESSASFPAAGREQLYVSLSRGKRQAVLYTDDFPALRLAVNRSQAKENAHDTFAPKKAEHSVNKTARLKAHARFMAKVGLLRRKAHQLASQLTKRKEKQHEQQLER